MSSDLFNPIILKQMKEDPGKVSRIIFSPEVELFFVPSAKLREMVSKNEHPSVKNMPEAAKALILSGKGHYLDKGMVWKFLTGKLDIDNTFVLTNGEIKVHKSNTTLTKGDS